RDERPGSKSGRVCWRAGRLLGLQEEKAMCGGGKPASVGDLIDDNACRQQRENEGVSPPDMGGEGGIKRGDQGAALWGRRRAGNERVIAIPFEAAFDVGWRDVIGHSLATELPTRCVPRPKVVSEAHGKSRECRKREKAGRPNYPVGWK